MRLLIEGGRIISPGDGINGIGYVLIEDGKIVEAAAGESYQGRPSEEGQEEDGLIVMGAKGKVVTPGLIDMHTHLRQPGQEYKETIHTGSRAAAKGGFTSIACMPNTDPPLDSQTGVEYVLSVARREGLVNVYPIAGITKGLAGGELTEIGALKKAGAVALSDDGHPVMNSEIMRRALEYTTMFAIPIIDHCEDINLSAGGHMHEGYTSTVLGIKGLPPESEEIMISRDILVAGLTGGHIHIAHLSTGRGVEMVREAKKRGVKVTCEATPHHFALTDADVALYNTNAKMSPPLRSSKDVEAIKEGLSDGSIDAIATDHAPHTPEEKEVEFMYAPFGIIGLETAIPLVITELVDKGIITLEEAVGKMTVEPARILGLDKGSLAAGADADVTIIDPEIEIDLEEGYLESKSRNTPLIGRRLKGFPVATIVGGKIVMEDGVIKHNA